MGRHCTNSATIYTSFNTTLASVPIAIGTASICWRNCCDKRFDFSVVLCSISEASAPWSLRFGMVNMET